MVVTEVSQEYTYAYATVSVLEGALDSLILPHVIKALACLVESWAKARNGRKVRIRIGKEIEMEARTVEEIEHLLEAAASFQDRPNRERKSTD